MICNAVVTAKCFENAESSEPRAVDVRSHTGARHGGVDLRSHTGARHGGLEPGSGSGGPSDSDDATFARNASMAAKNGRNSYTDTIKHIVLFRGGRHRRMLESGRHRRML